MKRQYKSSTHYILASLIPYTEANIKLAFAPNLFFKDLAKLDHRKEATLRSAYGRAVYQGLVEIDDDGIPRLTKKGFDKLKPYRSKTLKGSQIMVIFDIPEAKRTKRRILRALLREYSFRQIQKSVWVSNLDCVNYIREFVDQNDLQKSVLIYEVRAK